MRLPSCLVALLLAACSGPAAQTVAPASSHSPATVSAPPSARTTASSDPTPDLGERIAALVTDPALAVAATVAVVVLDRSGREVYAQHGGAALVPASTVKLVTAAAALTALGPDWHYVTPVRATVPIDAEGVLAGSLVLVGSGDPTLATPRFHDEVWPDRPWTPLDTLADQLVTQGLKQVTGDVLGDPSVLADEPLAVGWPSHYLTDLDTAYASGLTVNAGRRLIASRGRLRGFAAPDPAAEAAARLKGLLEERGVVVRGTAAATRHPPAAPLALASVASPPLAELLRHTVQVSDNHLADGIFRTLGAEVAGEGTWRGSAAAVQRTLVGAGLDWDGVVLADGSGLSRANRLSARLLAELDAVMQAAPVAWTWREVMAVAGESGTLRRRLRGTLGAGVFRGKTGSLTDVRAVSGSVDGPAGGRYHLAVVANGVSGDDAARVRRLQDELVLLLAEELHGCRRRPLPAPAPSPSGPPALAPYEVICA